MFSTNFKFHFLVIFVLRKFETNLQISSKRASYESTSFKRKRVRGKISRSKIGNLPQYISGENIFADGVMVQLLGCGLWIRVSRNIYLSEFGLALRTADSIGWKKATKNSAIRGERFLVIKGIYMVKSPKLNFCHNFWTDPSSTFLSCVFNALA